MTLRAEASGETGAILTRFFPVAADLLFRAHIEPDLIRQWMLGPEGWKMTRCETDPREGGAFRFDYAGEDDRRFSISGTYLAIERPGILKFREVMSMPEGETRTDIEIRFSAIGSGTEMKMALGYANSPIRDAVLGEAMLTGMEDSYRRLETLLAPPNSSA
jgi:uncharacterized protein YndB with AHSA1/START domain